MKLKSTVAVSPGFKLNGVAKSDISNASSLSSISLPLTSTGTFPVLTNSMLTPSCHAPTAQSPKERSVGLRDKPDSIVKLTPAPGEGPSEAIR